MQMLQRRLIPMGVAHVSAMGPHFLTPEKIKDHLSVAFPTFKQVYSSRGKFRSVGLTA
jgi:hypothetical protein